MLKTPPTVDIRAWFAMATTAPAGLLTLTHSLTDGAAAPEAGIYASILLSLMFLKALSRLEIRTIGWGIPEEAARPPQERLLAAAFGLTSVEACSVLMIVVAGVPLSGESVAVGLAVAAAPLAIGIGIYGLTPILEKFRLDIPERKVAPSLAAVVAVAASPRTPTVITPWTWALGPDQVSRSYRYGRVTLNATAYAPAPPSRESPINKIVLYRPRTWRPRAERRTAQAS